MNDQRTWKGSHTMSGPQLLRFLLWLHPTSIINHSEIGVMFTNLGPTLLQEMFISPKIDWRVEFPTHIDSLSEKRRRQRGLPKGSWWFQMSQAVPSKETQIRKQLKNSSIYAENIGIYFEKSLNHELCPCSVTFLQPDLNRLKPGKTHSACANIPSTVCWARLQTFHRTSEPLPARLPMPGGFFGTRCPISAGWLISRPSKIHGSYINIITI